MWKREMEWLLCVSDHIVELIPSWQTFPDGNKLEVILFLDPFQFRNMLFSYCANVCTIEPCFVQRNPGKREAKIELLNLLLPLFPTCKC